MRVAQLSLRYVAGLIAAVALHAAAPAPEVGRPFVRIYAPAESGVEDDIVCAAQDPRGVMLFGTRGAVVEFDGDTWRRVPVPARGFVTSLAVAENGDVWLCAEGEVGRLVATPSGLRVYQSMTAQIRAAAPDAALRAVTVVAHGPRVWLALAGALLRWEQQQFTAYPLDRQKQLDLFNLPGEGVFGHALDHGIVRLTSGEPVLLQEDFEFPGIVSWLSPRREPARWLVALADQPLSVVRREGGEMKLVPVPGRIERVVAGATLAHGGYVFLMARNGVAAVDDSLRLRWQAGVTEGIPIERIHSVFVDREGGIWVCAARGLMRIEDRMPVTVFDSTQGLAAPQTDVAPGLATLRPPRAATTTTTTAMAMLMSRPRNLLSRIGRDAGQLRALLGNNSVVRYDYDQKRFVADTLYDPTKVEPAADGPTAADALPERVTLGERSETARYVRVQGEWVALTSAGLRSYDRAVRQFVPFTRLGAEFADGSRFVRTLVTDPTGRIWLIVQTTPSDPDSTELLAIESDGNRRPLPREVRRRLGRIMSIQLDQGAAEGAVLWVIGFDTLGRIDLTRWSAPQPRPQLAVNLRTAQRVSGEFLPLAGEAPAFVQSARALRFSYAAAHFPLGGHVDYQTWLEGLEPGWSDSQHAGTREFTNLPVGRYTFRVRAQHGAAEGPASSYPFVILPPWWRSAPATAAWVLVVGGIIFGVARWRGRALRGRNEQLEALVADRTTELRASEEQLRVARDAAEAANRAKSTFLAHMSHELRTPLNGILGYAQVLRRDPVQSDAARTRLGVIVDSGEHLLALINEVLDLAKVEAGKMELRVTDVSLDRLARGVADIVRARCEEKQLAFVVEVASGLPRLVRTDEQKLRQVLLNLLGNAIKFTAQGRVTLSIAPTKDGRVRFAVEDTGPGISTERREALFTAFDSSTVQRGQGTGLGLVLSQRMVDLLGGRIGVSSAPGEGSRFWFDLPLPAVGSAEPFQRAAQRFAIGYRGVRRRLLVVVDDEAINRAVLRELLEPLGFAIDEAADGAAALAAAHGAIPDAILLDLRFAVGLDGFDIARQLRTAPELAHTKVIAVSASVFESDRHEALAAGCDAFLAKPFNEEQLFALLGATLGLEWERAQPAPAAPEAVALPLADAVRASLLELARQGDAVALRARLAELAKTPEHAAFARELDELAASFQMKRLRELLSEK